MDGRRDVFLEIDWLAPNGGVSYDPPDLTQMVDAFGRNNTLLVVDFSDQVPYFEIVMPFWGDHKPTTPFTGSPTWTSTRDLKEAYFDTAVRRGVFHLAHRVRQFKDLQTFNSGLAEGPGDDFLVSFRGSPPDDNVVNTFMHEHGHNLGLDHGGDGEGNGEANHLSVMNYEFQFSDLRHWSGVVRPDYSWAKLRTIDTVAGFGESNAMWQSSTPIDPDGLYYARWSCPPDTNGDIVPWEALPHDAGQVSLTAAQRKMDLNCDGDTADSGLTHELQDPTRAYRAVHTSGDDWRGFADANGDGNFDEGVQYNFQQLGGFSKLGAPADDEAEREQTEEEARAALSWGPAVRPDGDVYPGCSGAPIPTSGRVPVVLYGDALFDPTTVESANLHGATPVAATSTDLDSDGFDDLWLEYRVVDFTRLSATASQVALRRSGGRSVALVHHRRVPHRIPDGHRRRWDPRRLRRLSDRRVAARPRRVRAVIGLALFSCVRPDKADPPDTSPDHSSPVVDPHSTPHSPTDPRHSASEVPLCPGLDWIVHVDGPIQDAVEHALPTPEGDVIVAGVTFGGVRVGTGPEALAPGRGRDGFVARLTPAGQVVWSRVIGGPGIDQIHDVQLHGDALWIAGEVEGEMYVDGVAQDAVSIASELDAYGLVLGAADGALRDYRRIVWPEWQRGYAFAVDATGRRFLTGMVTFGAFGFAGMELTWGDINPSAAFLASWDPSGAESWATTFLPDRGQALGEALQVDVEPPLWGAFLIDSQVDAWSGGAHPDLPPEALDHHNVYTFDRATGQVGVSRFHSTLRSMYRFDAIPDGLRVYSLTSASQWVDGEGVAHEYHEPPAVGNGSVMETRADGGILDVMPQRDMLSQLYGGDVAAAGSRVVVGAGPSNPDYPWTLGAGTDREVVIEGTNGGEPNGLVVLYDQPEVFRCAWGLGGRIHEYARDAAFDGEGGIVVVGELNAELVVRDSDERTLATLTGETGTDGFVLRFFPPPPPE